MILVSLEGDTYYQAIAICSGYLRQYIYIYRSNSFKQFSISVCFGMLTDQNTDDGYASNRTFDALKVISERLNEQGRREMVKKDMRNQKSSITFLNQGQ